MSDTLIETVLKVERGQAPCPTWADLAKLDQEKHKILLQLCDMSASLQRLIMCRIKQDKVEGKVH